MGEISHLRAAVSRLKGKPFEILWVSLDDTKEIVGEMVRDAKLPGIHTWDEKGSMNPIAVLYNALALPTWYLMDAQGIIRARDPFGDKLVAAVNEMLGGTNTTP